MNKIVRGLCVALGIALFGGSYYLYNNFVNPPKIVHVTDNNYHREYSDDGSGSVNMVMLQGKITPGEAATDGKFGISYKTPILERKVEMYQIFKEGDKLMMGWKETPIKSVKDKNGKEYKNPEFPQGLKSMTIKKDFTMNNGALPIVHNVLNKGFSSDKLKDKFVILTLPENKTPEGFTYQKNHYLKASTGKTKIGSVRIYYKALSCNKLPEVTIIGHQTKGAVLWHSLDSRFYEGIKDLKEIKKTYTDDAPHAALGVACFGAFFVLLGLFKADV